MNKFLFFILNNNVIFSKNLYTKKTYRKNIKQIIMLKKRKIK